MSQSPPDFLADIAAKSVEKCDDTLSKHNKSVQSVQSAQLLQSKIKILYAKIKHIKKQNKCALFKLKKCHESEIIALRISNFNNISMIILTFLMIALFICTVGMYIKNQ